MGHEVGYLAIGAPEGREGKGPHVLGNDKGHLIPPGQVHRQVPAREGHVGVDEVYLPHLRLKRLKITDIGLQQAPPVAAQHLPGPAEHRPEILRQVGAQLPPG